ncbi:Arginine--tRNA ligase [Paenibacillus konkukensis]|uniref:Arginine--tRNA ligase n=1 Tax=Paenibacillus konkukensis TaxID=2020716 RepID=A0ABY4RL84_9BACL|nr:arginine--tRNA ligase [Paenibacillus konkukensis]UQZ82631.1 Arginine--tRNA ligase [Paenibacillus konkukensis]
MIRNIIVSSVERIVSELWETSGRERPAGVKVSVERPAHSEHGDYSVNAAMLLAKPLKRSPQSIASEIREKLMNDAAAEPHFHKIETAGPGFLNFYVNWAKWSAPGASSEKIQRKKEKVIIEHTSINPNKSAHVGHLRNSCIGDTIARMMKRSGYTVEVHNYIDDLGNQLADTVVGLLHTGNAGNYARFGDFCWDTYAKINREYGKRPELLQKRAEVLHELERGHTNTAWLGLLVAERIVREHLEEMKQFGIRYDVLVWESSIVKEGFWDSAFELLRTTPIFRRETAGKLAGCWVLKQEDAAGSEAEFQADKVLVRSNGILTYTAKDIAYHLWKFGVLGRDFRYKKFGEGLWSTDSEGTRKKLGAADMVVNVIDHRQKYPQAMVRQSLAALGLEKQAAQLRHVSYGVVSLSRDTAAGLGVDVSEGKHAYPMSGRQGIGIQAADLLRRMEEAIEAKRSRKAGLSSRTIAAAAIRYYLLRFHLQTEVVFDLAQATEISGNTGVYLLYAHARGCSILDKAGSEAEAITANVPERERMHPQELSLIRQLAYWPETLEAAAGELSPNTICAYAHELSTLFNHFYASCPILKSEGEERTFRLWLTARFQATLKDALEVLGLPAPRRM